MSILTGVQSQSMSAPVALVTASSAGLGAATAKGLARAGYSLVINYNSNKQKADNVVNDIQGLYNEPHHRTASATQAIRLRCVSVQADMSQKGDIKRLVEETVNVFGRIDCVVSNQGWTRMRQFDNLDDNIEEDDWDTCYNMNVKSHLYLFHACRPYLAASKGSFTTIASLAGVVPSGSSIPYAVTKAAQIHLVKALAKIAAPDIRANSISPGILLTEWGQKFSEEKLNTAVQKSALKKLSDIEDVVEQIVILAKGRSVTGQNMVIDAGWSLS